MIKNERVPISLQASASIAVPLWQTVLLRIGKKATVFIGLSVRNHTHPCTIIGMMRVISHTFTLLLTCEACLCLSQLFIPAVIIVACVPTNLPVFMTMCILMGFSVATIFLLPW